MTKRKTENRSSQAKKPHHRRRKPSGGKKRPHAGDQHWIYGTHAVHAALLNPARQRHSLLATKNAAEALPTNGLKPEIVTSADIERRLPPGSTHQGIALLTSPLLEDSLETLSPLSDSDVVVVLDQVTDPQNIGAILRSCAAFGAKALVMQERHSPPLSGVVAKAATGALEHIPTFHVTNISRALETLADLGYERLGLAEGSDLALPDYQRSGPAALVLGAEGSGLRRLTKDHCDQLISLPTCDLQSSLNVSNAAAVALYALNKVK